jgi:hypothetical protein
VPSQLSNGPLFQELCNAIYEQHLVDVKELWARYENFQRFDKACPVGFQQKAENTIVPKWPFYIDINQDAGKVKEMFEMLWGSCPAHVTFVEWARDFKCGENMIL